MKTYVTEESIFKVEPHEDITAFELTTLLKNGFHPNFWMKDSVDKLSLDYNHKMLTKLPKDVQRHFVKKIYKVKYKRRLFVPDEELSREIIETKRVTDLTTI